MPSFIWMDGDRASSARAASLAAPSVLIGKARHGSSTRYGGAKRPCQTTLLGGQIVVSVPRIGPLGWASARRLRDPCTRLQERTHMRRHRALTVSGSRTGSRSGQLTRARTGNTKCGAGSRGISP